MLELSFYFLALLLAALYAEHLFDRLADRAVGKWFARWLAVFARRVCFGLACWAAQNVFLLYYHEFALRPQAPKISREWRRGLGGRARRKPWLLTTNAPSVIAQSPVPSR